MRDPSGLTDEELKAALLQHGHHAGPITATTRLVYEKKLRRLMEPPARPEINGSVDEAAYSDSEEEEEEQVEEEEEQEELPDPNPETVACEEKEAAASQMVAHSVDDSNWYPQCFMPSSRLVKGRNKSAKPAPAPSGFTPAPSTFTPAPSGFTPAPSGFSMTALVEEIEKKRCLSPKTQPATQPASVHSWSGDRCLSPKTQPASVHSWSGDHCFSPATQPASVHSWSGDRWSGDRRPESCGRRVLDKFTMTGRSLLYSPPMSRHQMTCQVPVTDVLMEIFPEMEKTSTGISATRRRPIKGAAGRPVQFQYPDTPLSPNSAQQQEVWRRQVPLWVQLLIFGLVSALLFLTYVALEGALESPLTLLLDGLTQAAEAVEELAASGVEDAPVMADAVAPPILGE